MPLGFRFLKPFFNKIITEYKRHILFTDTMSIRDSSGEESLVGNPDAAQDLYGLGARIGFYL